MSHLHCNEFARASLSRRSFLLRAAGMAVTVYGGDRLVPQALQEGVAAATEGDAAPALVNVFFSGGLDSIGVLGPYGNGRYHDLRGALADVDDVVPFDGAPGWSWHPKAAGFDRLWQADRLTVLPTVGYSDPNQSHFTSRHFWEIGSTDIVTRTGWLGRFLDQDARSLPDRARRAARPQRDRRLPRHAVRRAPAQPRAHARRRAADPLRLGYRQRRHDTHAGQAVGFNRHLTDAVGALEAFQADLEARGIADRVLTFVWSEFGRRPEANGSAGTDHGAAAIAFLMGTRAAPRVIGAMPDLAAGALDPHGNLRHTVDFRDVYGSLVRQWLEGDPEQVVPGASSDLPLLR